MPRAAQEALTAQPKIGVDLPHRGAFTCELTIGPELSADRAPSEVERDRMLMAHPGMRQKMLPLSFGPEGTLFMGGRYLFETREQAADYEDFVLRRYTFDGVQFSQRPYFKQLDCRSWSTIGAHDFADFRTQQVVLRTERWTVPNPGGVQRLLRERWPQLRAAAAARGLTSVWLLLSERDAKVQLVYYADRVGPHDPTAPDFASLGALSSSPALGALFDDQTTWTKDMDKTQWVFTIWQPFEPGDQGAPSIFPYSPPLPGLTCGDGLCVPSQGESAQTCASDCTPNCGDAVCQPADGEDLQSCPGDCR